MRAVAASAVAGAVLALSACGAGSSPSASGTADLTVAYQDTAGAHSATRQVSGLHCTIDSKLTFYGTDAASGRPAEVSASVATGDAYVLSISIGDGLWFLSGEQFAHDDDDGATFDAVTGRVVRMDGLTVTETVAPEAMLDGRIVCG